MLTGAHRGRVYRLEGWGACQQLERVSQLATLPRLGGDAGGGTGGNGCGRGCLWRGVYGQRRLRSRGQARQRSGVWAAACVEAWQSV